MWSRDVPKYSMRGKSDATVMRMFERDKDELRSFGVPIETVVVAEAAARARALGDGRLRAGCIDSAISDRLRQNVAEF